MGVRRLDFERPEMNLSDLSLRIANTNRAAARLPEPYGRRRLGGTRNMKVACDGGAVLARRLVCYIETGDVPSQPSAGKHARWPQFCESRPVQLAASHLVRAEATVSCRGRGGSALD